MATPMNPRLHRLFIHRLFIQRLFILCAAALITILAAPAGASPNDSEAFWRTLKTNGAIVLFRHAIAPGGGDPAGFKLGECSTQRNLSLDGQAQARQIGQRFREHNIRVGAVIQSQWCRTQETARLAFPGQSTDAPEFNSFFSSPEAQAAQTAQARERLLNWGGPGVLVVVTHQVNITALTGVVPASGEGIVVKKEGVNLQVVGRLSF